MSTEARLQKLEAQFSKIAREIKSLRGGKQLSVTKNNRIVGTFGGNKKDGTISSTRRTPERGGKEIVPRGHWMKFVFVEGKSNKFWSIRLAGQSMITHWGRVGTVGQETTKRYATTAQAKTAGEKLITEKLQKGYRLIRENPTRVRWVR